MDEWEDIDEFKAIMKEPGVSGYEEKVRDKIRELVSGYGDTRVDNIGNLISEKPGDGPHIALVAHMDEIGLVVSNIEDNGYLRIMKMGGVKDSLLMGRQVTVHSENGEHTGVIGHKAPHLVTKDEEKDEVTPWTETHVDVGASSAEEVREMGIDVPDPITFQKPLRVMNDKIITGRPLDNRIGCFVLLRTLKELSEDKLEHKLSFVWSVQEEVGLRGAKVVGNTLKPDYVIALDTYTTTDSPGLESFYKPIKPGQGPVIRMVDVRAISTPRLVKHFKEQAEGKDIPHQYGVTGGTTDGMAVQESGSLMVSLGVPLRYSHSTVECAHWDDVMHLIKLVSEGVKSLPI